MAAFTRFMTASREDGASPAASKSLSALVSKFSKSVVPLGAWPPLASARNERSMVCNFTKSAGCASLGVGAFLRFDPAAIENKQLLKIAARAKHCIEKDGYEECTKS